MPRFTYKLCGNLKLSEDVVMSGTQGCQEGQGPVRVMRIGLLAAVALGIAAFAAADDAIRREALRPNHDPDGRPLPLASRWNAHNYVQGGVVAPGESAGVHYPFPLSRLLDEIEAGHRIFPFFSWPSGGQWSEPLPQLEASFARLAAAGLPFEVACGNIEDAMFGAAERYWQKPMEQNPAHIRADVQGAATAAAAAGATVVVASGWTPAATNAASGYVIFSGHGWVYPLDGPIVADGQGVAQVRLQEPLAQPVAAGETVALVQRKMDYWSAAPLALWEQAGEDLVDETFGAVAATWQRLAAIYPDPPLVEIVSNNEGGGTTRIGDAAKSWHAQRRLAEFDASYPEPREDTPLRLAHAHGYIEKMGAYFRGIRRALPWADGDVKLIGYNAFGVNFEVGRWGGWCGDAVPVREADLYAWLAWDGAAPDFYVYDWNYATDEHVGSPHIGAMQAYAMLAPRAEAAVSNYQWQVALWDGGMRQRYRYANWGELPPTQAVGTMDAVATNGATQLAIAGALPGAVVLRQGDMISIAGHSDYHPANGETNPYAPMRIYTAAGEVRADAAGRASIPLSVATYNNGAVLSNDHYDPVALGAAVFRHDYIPRYEGLCNLALWLTRPRVIREFAWGDYNRQIEVQWQALLRAVDRVWDDPVLARFWRQGLLVVNPDYEAATGFKHPLWELTDDDAYGRYGPWRDRWQQQDRFHQLTVAINPPFAGWPQRYEVANHTAPFSTQALIKVWAIAYQRGEAPQREWLLVTQSPRADRGAVSITVPGFGEVSVHVARRGSFYHLREGHPTPVPVGLDPVDLVLADRITGSTRFTNSNTVDIIGFPVMRGYDRTCVTQDETPPAGGWLAYDADAPPAGLTAAFTIPAAEGEVAIHAWFKDSRETDPLPPTRVEGRIAYTTAAPVVAVRAGFSRERVGEEAIVVLAEEIDGGSTGGGAAGQSLAIHSRWLTLLGGPDVDATPDDPWLTVAKTGVYTVRLSVMNEAGNVASDETAFSVTQRGAGAVVWTGTGDSDWFNPVNWNPAGVPAAGTNVLIDGGASVCLSNSTPTLASLVITNATLTTTNWTTAIAAVMVTVRAGGVITCAGPFTNAPAMTNRVHILCTDLMIDPGGAIDVRGKGYRGGVRLTGESRNGCGPGGGAGGDPAQGGGHGGYGGRQNGDGREFGGARYGSASAALLPGSGGGDAYDAQGGTPGGGAVRIEASGRVTVNGSVLADALPDNYDGLTGRKGTGSGGSIYITCQTLAGTGLVSADGGTANNTNPQGSGGGGRVAVYSDPVVQALEPAPAVRFSAGCGARTVGETARGGIGSIWLTDSRLLQDGLANVLNGRIERPLEITTGSVLVTNRWLGFGPKMQVSVTGDLLLAGAFSKLELGGTQMASFGASQICRMDAEGGLALEISGELVLTNSAQLRIFNGVMDDPAEPATRVCVGGNMHVYPNASVFLESHPTNGASPLFVVGSLTLETNATITAGAWATSGERAQTAGGFAGAWNNSSFAGTGSTRWGWGSGRGYTAGGAGYGGVGYRLSGDGGWVYGSSNAPALPGSGGGCGNANWGGGGSGAGLVRVVASDRITLKPGAKIVANGAQGRQQANADRVGGGGSGGGISLRTRRFTGSQEALLSANGGRGALNTGGGGGGGRIAVWRMRDLSVGPVTASVAGGLGRNANTNAPAYDGAPGTVVMGCPCRVHCS